MCNGVQAVTADSLPGAVTTKAASRAGPWVYNAPVEPDSPATLWTLRRGTSVRECQAIFIRTHVQARVLVNGTLIYTFTFPEGDTVTGGLAKWRREYLAEGWVEEPAATRGGNLRHGDPVDTAWQPHCPHRPLPEFAWRDLRCHCGALLSLDVIAARMRRDALEVVMRNLADFEADPELGQAGDENDPGYQQVLFAGFRSMGWKPEDLRDPEYTQKYTIINGATGGLTPTPVMDGSACARYDGAATASVPVLWHVITVWT